MSELEKNIKQILFSNDSAVIAEEVIDLLLRVRDDPDMFQGAVDLLYPKLDHWQEGKGQYMAAREQAISARDIHPAL